MACKIKKKREIKKRFWWQTEDDDSMRTKKIRQKKPVCKFLPFAGEQTGHAFTGLIKRLLGGTDDNVFSN